MRTLGQGPGLATPASPFSSQKQRGAIQAFVSKGPIAQAHGQRLFWVRAIRRGCGGFVIRSPALELVGAPRLDGLKRRPAVKAVGGVGGESRKRR
jgi:hypothetical protein